MSFISIARKVKDIFIFILTMMTFLCWKFTEYINSDMQGYFCIIQKLCHRNYDIYFAQNIWWYLLEIFITMPNSNLNMFCVIIKVIDVEEEFVIENRIIWDFMHGRSLVFILLTIHRHESTFHICIYWRWFWSFKIFTFDD